MADYVVSAVLALVVLASLPTAARLRREERERCPECHVGYVVTVSWLPDRTRYVCSRHCGWTA